MLKILSTCALACVMPVTAASAAPVVVTDLPPVHALAALVAGDLTEPVLLMDEPGDGHGFALRPSQAAALGRADLAIWTGAAMSPWMDRALQGAGVEGLALLDAPGTRLRAWEERGHEDEGHDHDHGHDHDDHHDHDHGHDHGHDHDHDHGETDPHAWLEPANAIYWLDLIARRLGAQDPENAEIYLTNAKAAAAEISALDAELRGKLAPLAGRSFVLGHDAYGYFTSHYGLSVAGTVAAGDAGGPGAAHLSALRQSLKDRGVVCAFPEVGQSPRLLETVLDGSGVKTGAALDPAGSGLEKGPGLYKTLLRDLAGKISDCLAE